MFFNKNSKVKNSNSHVPVSFFYTPAIPFAYKFLELIDRLREKFDERVIFEPLIKTISSKSEAFMAKHCLSRGQYCVFGASENDRITGKDILIEGLRQICIYKMNMNMYFFYTKIFHEACLDSFTEDCSKKIIDKSFLSWTEITKCVDSSFSGSEKDTFQNDNSILFTGSASPRRSLTF